MSAGIYQAALLKHHRAPQGYGKPDTFTMTCRGDNVLCGDTITVYLDGEGTLTDVHFEAEACAIVRASASMMVQHVVGLKREDALKAIGDVHALLTGANHEFTGDLVSLEALHKTPARLRCGMLPWETLRCALTGGKQTDTESDQRLVLQAD